MERDFQLGDKKFKLNKLDAFKQFHVARRMTPLLADIVPVMQKLAPKIKNEDTSMTEEQKFDALMPILTPILTGLSKLTDEDANYVMHNLLSCVEYQYMSAWATVSTGKELRFQDLELPVLLQVAGRSFMYNLSGFMAALPRP